jgi:ankyrin repeat protein
MPSNDDWYEQERLHRAADEGDLLEMKKLVSIGLDVNLFDDLARTPLHYAVQAGHYKAAQWLLDNKAGVNANDEKKSAKHLCVLRCRATILKWLSCYCSKALILT